MCNLETEVLLEGSQSNLGGKLNLEEIEVQQNYVQGSYKNPNLTLTVVGRLE